jgi:hypothetical protein
LDAVCAGKAPEILGAQPEGISVCKFRKLNSALVAGAAFPLAVFEPLGEGLWKKESGAVARL